MMDDKCYQILDRSNTTTQTSTSGEFYCSMAVIAVSRLAVVVDARCTKIFK